MEYLIIKDNTIANVILWDGKSEWAPPEDHEVEPRVGDEWVGWTRIDGVWANPNPPIEEET